MQSAVTWLSSAVRDGIDGIESWVAALSPIDFMLVVAVVVALYWIVSALYGSTRLGPIEVKPIEHDAALGTAPATNALTAQLRERLATSGLMPPPAVPSGSPQSDLIAAVEASGEPQSPLVAAVLKLLPQPPRPPSYTLTATWCASPDGSHWSARHALRYWLQPKNDGAVEVGCVVGKSHDDVIRRTAATIFMTLSRDAVHVFPEWSRWPSDAALLHYLDGIDARVGGRTDAAYTEFDAAIASSADSGNPLPRLQVANLREAGRPRKGEGSDAWKLLTMRAEALSEYLDLGFERPHLVAARYRAGVLAGMLANEALTGRRLSDAGLPPIARNAPQPNAGGQTPQPSDDELRNDLHALARSETKAAWQLLGWTHVARSEFRMRHRYEPRGRERRELRRTVDISRRTSRLRKLSTRSRANVSRARLWWTDARVTALRARVRLLLAPVLRPTAGWNAHYNAACFYALLHERAYGRANDSADKVKKHRMSAIRRRAYEELGTAVDKAGHELEKQWWTKRDPDLESLRRLDATQWKRFVGRHLGEPGARGHQLPDPVRGEPNRRRNAWLLISFVVAVPAAVALLSGGPDAVTWPLCVLTTAAIWRTAFLYKQSRAANRRALRTSG